MTVMDLDFRGRSDLADEFCGRYAELCPEDETLSQLLPFFRCHRAMVRGKVESLTTREAEIGRDQALDARERAARYFDLAQRYATEELPPSLVIIGGLSGTGKSHLAAALASRIGAVLVRSDAVRREMLGAGVSAPHGPTYTREDRARVYAAARERVLVHLHRGRMIVFDATHVERCERDAARALATPAAVPSLLTWVDAPSDVVRSRLDARDIHSDGLSDARWDTYLAQRDRLQPLADVENDYSIEIDGTDTATANVARIIARLSDG